MQLLPCWCGDKEWVARLYRTFRTVGLVYALCKAFPKNASAYFFRVFCWVTNAVSFSVTSITAHRIKKFYSGFSTKISYEFYWSTYRRPAVRITHLHSCLVNSINDYIMQYNLAFSNFILSHLNSVSSDAVLPF